MVFTTMKNTARLPLKLNLLDPAPYLLVELFILEPLRHPGAALP